MQIVIRLVDMSKRLSSLAKATTDYRSDRAEIGAALTKMADDCLAMADQIKRASEKKDR